MKTNLKNLDLTQFNIQEGVIAGEKAFLVTPNDMGVRWTAENSIFRSSIWNEEGELISAGFRKFTNYGEQPEYEPLDIEGLTYVEKLDGSLLIFSWYKGELIIRTRGTFDACRMPNGSEIYGFLKDKYPLLFEAPEEDFTSECSMLFEWETPSNVIVERRVKEPTLTLVGFVIHYDYSYIDQNLLNEVAGWFNVPRPRIFSFGDINAAIEDVKNWQEGEGVIAYSKDGQILKKFKAEKYLLLHRTKSSFAGKRALVELWQSVNSPRDIEQFKLAIDFELLEFLEPQMVKICERATELDIELKWVEDHLKQQTKDRKVRAMWLQTLSPIRQQLGFPILSGKPERIEKVYAEYVQDA